MSHKQLRRKAIILRKQRKSYSQIKSILGLSKSTLSRWLRSYPLTADEINSLRAQSEIRIEKYRLTMAKKRKIRLDHYYQIERKKYLPLTFKELLIAGLFLYWGEGNKADHNTLSINNTDPQLLKFALYWMIKGLKISKSKIKVYMHLYDDMNIKNEMRYWSKVLNIPMGQFIKPYIKKSKRITIDQKGFGHGTCGIRISDTVIKEHTLMAIKSIADKYDELITKLV